MKPLVRTTSDRIARCSIASASKWHLNAATSKFIFPAQIHCLNSKLMYPTAHLISPFGCLTCISKLAYTLPKPAPPHSLSRSWVDFCPSSCSNPKHSSRPWLLSLTCATFNCQHILCLYLQRLSRTQYFSPCSARSLRVSPIFQATIMTLQT